MTTQHLPTVLPPGWESDYDGTSERWFFIHRPTGFSQFFFPRAGDENTRIAELAQPQPTSASLAIKMEAMNISKNENPDVAVPNPPLVARQTAQPNNQQQQQGQIVPPIQLPSIPQASPLGQQSPSQGSPLARTVSGSIQRKAVSRRDSVQSQASTTSSRTSGQPTQQQQAINPQMQSSTTPHTQNTQNTQPVQYQQPQVINYAGSMQTIPLQTQPTPIYYQNNHSQQAPQPQIQAQYATQQAGLPIQSQVHQSTTQTVQYQQAQPLNVVTGQPVQQQVYQTSLSSPHAFTPTNQICVQPGQAPMHQPQAMNSHIQAHNSYPQQQMTSLQMQAQYSNPQQQIMNPQIQPQYTISPTQNQTTPQNPAAGQRRFSTIPVSQQTDIGQIPSPPPQVNPAQGVRHSSIGTNIYQSPPLIQQMQPVPGQPGQFVPASQNFAPQMPQQASSIVQSSPGVQYIQQNVAPLPPTLPPPAPGMQWVLVQPGNQQPQVQSAQTVQNPNQSSQYAVQMQQFGGAQVAGMSGRPGLVTRLSASRELPTSASQSLKNYLKTADLLARSC